jgi:UDP-N-acetylglucosamine transferase subunit ALG13
MILVTIGTYEAPFDRLLRQVARFESDEPVVVQHGMSQIRPPGATCVAYVPFDELAAFMQSARVVITHAGVGSILLATASGKRPIVVPRMARFGEAVDDHQVAFARRLADDGMVTLVEDPADLPVAIRSVAPEAESISGDAGPLIAELTGFLDRTLGALPAAGRT